jgi:carbon storage regulator CsrA
MLVISRHENESFWIGDNIEITIVECRRGGRARVGITCPKNIPVMRSELLTRDELDHHIRQATEDSNDGRTR